ncbi:MAG TPA: MATE family efflux transporter, partial [Candidatus Saccharimonadales bacterium]|nr:MATE family efflux transporter [Candidatus Saccharimonadales bacterium]
MNLKQNTIINLAGSVLTLIVSVITVPLNLSLIGNARYGALAIVWVLLGYFGLFELGTGKAIANRIAKLRGSSQQEIERSFWTALFMNAGFGTLGGVVLLLLGHILLGSLFKIPPELRAEAVSALPWIAVSVPFVTISAVLCGALEGKEHFLTTNLSLV